MRGVALVTGAGRGIGSVIARALGAEGVAVAAFARSEDDVRSVAEDIGRGGGRAIAVPCDVCDEHQVEAAVRRVARELGPIDLLVNNAGTMASGPFWEISPDDWWRDVEVSVRGAFLCTRAVLPGMLERGGGRIVSLSSRIATRADPWCSSYACAKAGLIRMTDCLQAEAGDRGVKAFALNPGVVRTEMTDELMRAKWLGDDLRSMTEEQWSPPELAASIVVRVAAGEADPLSGRFLDAPTGLDAQLAGIERTLAEDRWTLRLRE